MTRFTLARRIFTVWALAGGYVNIPARVYRVPLQARGNSLWIAIKDDDDVQSIVRYQLAR